MLPSCLTPAPVLNNLSPMILDDIITCWWMLRKIFAQPLKSRYSMSFNPFTRSKIVYEHNIYIYRVSTLFRVISINNLIQRICSSQLHLGCAPAYTALPINRFLKLFIILVVKNVIPSVISFLWVSGGWCTSSSWGSSCCFIYTIVPTR